MMYKWAIIGLFCGLAYAGIGQDFEGVITFHVVNAQLDQTSVLTVKEDKSVLEVKVDSLQDIKIIKDESRQTTTILRRNDNQKYGFRSPTMHGGDASLNDISQEEEKIHSEPTGQTKLIGLYQSAQVKIKSDKGEAEAWVTKDIGQALTTYFPEFVGVGTDPDARLLRQVANRMGFILQYTEKLYASDEQTKLNVTVEEKEIPNDAFAIDPQYIILDEDGMKRLYGQAQQDPEKKAQWEEFRKIFGNK